ncbi:hypothetical protein PVAP13_1KG390505 [Panicum virgatum]|uniref:Uncharacterized protein n=1 Tax=Panicum virgatum TaxID=38727 RepID=A0A8T0XS88_PANVG|nr:hypothetical protein PVAP13_1KG390505 [Panicum virgatum]
MLLCNRAARRGALPFYNNGASSSTGAEVVYNDPALTPPPLAPAVASRRPGLRRFIPTGHIPTRASMCGPEARPPCSGEGEA